MSIPKAKIETLGPSLTAHMRYLQEYRIQVVKPSGWAGMQCLENRGCKGGNINERSCDASWGDQTRVCS